MTHPLEKPIPLPVNVFASEAEVRKRLTLADLDPAAIDAAAALGTDLVAAAHALAGSGAGEAAVAVLAQGLHRRAAVWWACLVVRREPAPEVPPANSPRVAAAREGEIQAIEAAEAWVRSPSEALAQAAHEASKAVPGTPAGLAALAAFLGGESLSPPGAMPVPPGDHLAGIAASGAIRIAAVRHRPETAPATLRDFLELGRAVAAGHHRWEPSAGADGPQDSGAITASRGH